MPDFSIYYPKNECDMLQDAHDAISKCELWDWMRSYSPHANEGFMFSQDPNLNRISDAMLYRSHSGASWGWTMRVMEGIAKAGGWDGYRKKIEARWPADRLVCSCRAKVGHLIGWCSVAGGGVPGCEH